MLRALFVLPLVLAPLACSGSAAPSPSPRSTETPQTGDPDGGAAVARSGEGCLLDATSTLDGVTIRFTASPLACTFTLAEVAKGIDLPYEIVVAHDVAGTAAHPHACSAPGANGLAPYESVDGAGQHYGIDDTGLCAPSPTDPPPITVKAGTYPGVFHWDGRNWSGPSDYGAPEGAAFPAGSYVLTVSASGTQSAGGTTTAYDVVAKLHVDLVP